MTNRATGTFNVTLNPLPLSHQDAPLFGRFSIDKEFHGDVEGNSTGEMLSAGTAVQGSAGYVAIERVVGSLHGKSGSFTLKHSGTLSRGAPSLDVTVVPDSGTDQLEGLTGTMTIDPSSADHGYVFEYTLPTD